MSKRYVVEKTFQYYGYTCVIIFGDLGFRCGYVGVPIWHPLYKVEYYDIDKAIDVHGGLTYSGGLVDYPIESEALWWFGFDCGHCWDGNDYELASKLFPDNNQFYQMQYMIPDCPVCNIEYVEEECKKLAEQLKKYEGE